MSGRAQAGGTDETTPDGTAQPRRGADELDRFLAALDALAASLHAGPVPFTPAGTPAGAPRPDRAACRNLLHGAAFILLVPLARDLSRFDDAVARIYCRMLDAAGPPTDGSKPPAQTLVAKLAGGALTAESVATYIRGLHKDRTAASAIALVHSLVEAALVVANAYPAETRDDARVAVFAYGRTLVALVRRIAALDNEVSGAEQALLGQLVAALPMLRDQPSPDDAASPPPAAARIREGSAH